MITSITLFLWERQNIEKKDIGFPTVSMIIFCILFSILTDIAIVKILFKFI